MFTYYLGDISSGVRKLTHTANERTGPKVAAILSVIQGCRRLRLPAREFIAPVLRG
jgi:transposase